MTEFVSEALFRTTDSGDRLSVPVHTPDYQYLVCDLLTDELWASPAFKNVTFERRLSRPGSFSGQLEISTRAQAEQADELSNNCGRLALWILRNKQLWWGGILWGATPAINSRKADVVQFSGSTFDSYPYRVYLDSDWAMDTVTDMTRKVVNIWDVMQNLDAESHIGVSTTYTNIVNEANNFLPLVFKESDLVTHGDMIEEYTDDPVAGIDYTIDVFFDDDGTRVKQVRTAGSFALVPAPAPIVVSGYRIPSWGINRGTDDMGTNFRAWANYQQPNVGEEATPLPGSEYKAMELINEGWPRLDKRVQLEGTFNSYGDALGRANLYAKQMRQRQSGIKDIVTYDIDLSSSGWHPNLIGQRVTVKHSKRDLWYPGRTRVVAPVVAAFSVPDRGSPETVKFTFDNTREVAF